jgi:hypothetical protein
MEQKRNRKKIDLEKCMGIKLRLVRGEKLFP